MILKETIQILYYKFYKKRLNMISKY